MNACRDLLKVTREAPQLSFLNLSLSFGDKIMSVSVFVEASLKMVFVPACILGVGTLGTLLLSVCDCIVLVWVWRNGSAQLVLVLSVRGLNCYSVLCLIMCLVRS